MDQNQMMLEYLMEMGAMQPEQEAIARKQAMVNQLRQAGQMPGMRAHGRINTAAHPLEMLGAMANQGVGEYQNRQANQMQDQYGARRRAALGGLQARMQPPVTDQNFTGVGAAPY